MEITWFKILGTNKIDIHISEVFCIIKNMSEIFQLKRKSRKRGLIR